MSEIADVIIVGAGIIGLNTALQIVRRSRQSVVVLEKGIGLGEGSTGASSAVCRFRYSRPEMIQLAKDGIHAYRHWNDYVQLSEPRARFHNDGVLWLGDGRLDWPAEEQVRLGTFGVNTEVLDDQAIRENFPAINPCTIAPDLKSGSEHECRGGGKHLLEVDGGYVDPVDALQDLLQAARGAGVEVRLRSHVTRILVEGGRVGGVQLADGRHINSGSVVNAAGPWCNPLFEEAGVSVPWPLEPTRIQVVHLDRPMELEGHIPVCVDQNAGIYFRLQNRGQQIILSSVLEKDEKEAVIDPDDFARYIDDDYARAKMHGLLHRLPTLSVRKLIGYSGLYTINRSDVHPIVGPTEIPGLYAANGCSGHGFKLAPAIGALLAQLITGNTAPFDTSVPLAFLAVDRSPIILESKSVLA